MKWIFIFFVTILSLAGLVYVIRDYYPEGLLGRTKTAIAYQRSVPCSQVSCWGCLWNKIPTGIRAVREDCQRCCKGIYLTKAKE